jgi:anti-sigma B factor antagonist
MALEITITEEKDAVIMALAGKIDSFSTGELQRGFDHVKETGSLEIILLLKDLEYLDSRGIGAFLSFFKAIKDAGGVVRIAEAPPNILELLNVLGVEGLARIYPSLELAMENSSGEGPTQEVRQKSRQIEEEHLLQDPLPSPSKAPYVLAAAGVVIVVILVFLFLKPAKRATGPESDVGPKLELLERRVAQLESRIAAPSPLEEKVEGFSKGFSERLSLMEKHLAGLRQDVESLKKPVGPAAAPEKVPTPAPPAYHVVSRGDTLYRIALRYNMTLEELRRLNDLKPDQPLLVGQRLRVKAQ